MEVKLLNKVVNSIHLVSNNIIMMMIKVILININKLINKSRINNIYLNIKHNQIILNLININIKINIKIFQVIILVTITIITIQMYNIIH
jgi:hypothetical protein